MAVKKNFASFADMLAQSNKPILVDFYATWCGPCQMMVPILNDLSNHWREQIQVVKIDTDKYPAIASQYQIQALPTLVLFKKGTPVHRIEGVHQTSDLMQQLQGFL